MIDPGRLNIPSLKSNAPTPAPGSRAPAQGRSASGAPSVIGADLTITGNLESRGEVQIEGDLQGDVNAAKIVIGERARITGSLTAEEIVIRGSVQGSIRGNSVTFQSTSHVEGDVFHKSLSIEQGAYFEGKSRRSDDPMAVPRNNGIMPPPHQ
ncbi:MAG: polymer-forming cytoskeletal protein [Hyphomicrobiaceae bacterium]|nr:polymer-forming cytoskeletal protein [Hyphomicrobiaceae bacterium]